MNDVIISKLLATPADTLFGQRWHERQHPCNEGCALKFMGDGRSERVCYSTSEQTLVWTLGGYLRAPCLCPAGKPKEQKAYSR